MGKVLNITRPCSIKGFKKQLFQFKKSNRPTPLTGSQGERNMIMVAQAMVPFLNKLQ